MSFAHMLVEQIELFVFIQEGIRLELMMLVIKSLLLI